LLAASSNPYIPNAFKVVGQCFASFHCGVDVDAESKIDSERKKEKKIFCNY
jgi:hypothetical protein